MTDGNPFPVPPIEIIYGPDIWNVRRQNAPLVDGVLWEGDVVMLLGSEKAGKSILGLQLAFCLAGGSAFLDKYPVPNPVPVLYLQTEGKESELVERMHHMAEVLPLKEEHFLRVFRHFLPLDERGVMPTLLGALEQLPVVPKVIIVDSLYTSMTGDLNENLDVRRLHAQLGLLMERFGITVVLIHHESKEQWESGKQVDRGDRGSYGSVFLRAWVSHILYLKKHKDKSRTLTCTTQRSGRILEQEDLILVEPNPLQFQIKDRLSPSAAKVLHFLQQYGEKGLTREQLIEHTGLSMPSIENALSQHLADQKVMRTNTRPVVYRVCS